MTVEKIKTARPKLVPVFDFKICMACGVCVMACPFSCIELSEGGVDRYGKMYPRLDFPDTCTGCKICMNACPLDCIRMEELSGPKIKE